MKLNLVVAILAIAAVPGWVQAQNAGTDENVQFATPEQVAQRAFDTISNDKTQIKAYCGLSKVNDQLNEANQKGDKQAILKLSQQLGELTNKIDPNAAWVLGTKLADKQLWAQVGVKVNESIQATVDKLDGLCESMQQEPDGSAGSEGRSDNIDDNTKAR